MGVVVVDDSRGGYWMAAPSLTEILAEMLLTGIVELDDGFDDIADVLSAAKDIAVPDPERDFSHLFVAAVEESRLTPVELYAREGEPPARIGRHGWCRG